MNCADFKKYAFIFPGAGMSDLRNIIKGDIGSTMKEILHDKAHISRNVTGIDVWKYISSEEKVSIEELADQVVLHTVNCSIGEFLLKQGINPSIICGYSMGIYSALVCGKAISFENGLDMVQNAYFIMKKSLKDKCGAMAAIIGLNRNELESVIAKSNTTYPVEIANSNGKFNMIITGIYEDVHLVMQFAENEGAFKVIDIKVSLPYHHSYFFSDAAEGFLNYLRNVKILDLQIPLMSSIDQKIMTSSSDVRFELYKNIKSSMSWHETINMMAQNGINNFVEVGMGNSLQKIVRTINKGCRVYTEKDFLGGCYELQQSV